MIEIRLLGPLDVRDGERDLTPRRQKQRALLAALALRVGVAVSADRLVDDLWADQAPKTARHALENYVSELRKALGKHLIETKPNGYVLELDREQVDVVRFERLVAEARAAATDERAEKLRSALSLVRGEPLADLAFEPFAAAESARLQDLEVSAREELVDADLELGRHASAVSELERLVAAHPFRERLRAQLMLALYRGGRQADALAAYQNARHALLDDLGIDPSEELQELERAILRQDPSLRLPPVAAPTMPHPSTPAVPARRARKTITVSCSGLANSATLADHLDPEPLRALLDRYHDAAGAAAARHGGVSSVQGSDVVRAVFGVPVAREDDALRAVRAADELREAVGVLNDSLLPELGVFLEVRTGVDTGEVLVEGAGADAATGQPVSNAERLQREALAGQILLGEKTYALVRAAVEAEELAESSATYRLVQLQADAHGRPLRLDSPLVGRRRQLAALAGAFEQAVSDGAPHLFTVLGPAGVGKSRLVRELVQNIDGVATALEGRCLPYGEGITYWPVTQALRGAGLMSRDLDPSALTVDVVRTVIEPLARETPLVLVLDDLHWAEPALLDLVEQLVDSCRAAPVLVVCLARPELLETRPTWGGGKVNATSLLLEPLGEAESERLVDNLLGESDLADPIRDYIIRSAEGNPLFVEELLATLVERDVLRRESGRWTTTTVAAVPLPPTILALVAARIDRLPAPERHVLELASVEGRSFHRPALAALGGNELEDGVDRHLAALVRKELVRPAPEEELFSFRHQVIRDTAYASLPMRERAELHERLAGWLRSTPAAENELATYHVERARRYRAAVGA